MSYGSQGMGRGRTSTLPSWMTSAGAGQQAGQAGAPEASNPYAAAPTAAQSYGYGTAAAQSNNPYGAQGNPYDYGAAASSSAGAQNPYGMTAASMTADQYQYSANQQQQYSAAQDTSAYSQAPQYAQQQQQYQASQGYGAVQQYQAAAATGSASASNPYGMPAANTGYGSNPYGATTTASASNPYGTAAATSSNPYATASTASAGAYGAYTQQQQASSTAALHGGVQDYSQLQAAQNQWQTPAAAQANQSVTDLARAQLQAYSQGAPVSAASANPYPTMTMAQPTFTQPTPRVSKWDKPAANTVIDPMNPYGSRVAAPVDPNNPYAPVGAAASTVDPKNPYAQQQPAPTTAGLAGGNPYAQVQKTKVPTQVGIYNPFATSAGAGTIPGMTGMGGMAGMAGVQQPGALTMPTTMPASMKLISGGGTSGAIPTLADMMAGGQQQRGMQMAMPAGMTGVTGMTGMRAAPMPMQAPAAMAGMNAQMTSMTGANGLPFGTPLTKENSTGTKRKFTLPAAMIPVTKTLKEMASTQAEIAKTAFDPTNAAMTDSHREMMEKLFGKDAAAGAAVAKEDDAVAAVAKEDDAVAAVAKDDTEPAAEVAKDDTEPAAEVAKDDTELAAEVAKDDTEPTPTEPTPATPATPPSDSESKEQFDWDTLKVAELRAECKSRGLDTPGKKSELVERLQKADPCKEQ